MKLSHGDTITRRKSRFLNGIIHNLVHTADIPRHVGMERNTNTGMESQMNICVTMQVTHKNL